MTDRKRNSTTGLIIAVVEAVVDNRQLKDIATTVGCRSNTVHRVLAKLVSAQWVVRVSKGQYVLGPALLNVTRRRDAEN